MNELYNNFWRRLLAALFDELLLIPMSIFIGYITSNNISTFIITSLLYAFLYSFYFIYFHHKHGQTLGKYLLSIKVMNVNETRLISLSEAIKREGLLFVVDVFLLIFLSLKMYKLHNVEELTDVYSDAISILSIAWIFIEVITMLSNKKGRALHDYLGNSVVVKTA